MGTKCHAQTQNSCVFSLGTESAYCRVSKMDEQNLKGEKRNEHDNEH